MLGDGVRGIRIIYEVVGNYHYFISMLGVRLGITQ